MTRLQRSILKTLAYADIFDYPLTAREIHKWLISKKAVKLQALQGQALKLKIQRTKSFYHLPNRQNIVSLRQSRQQFSLLKLRKAQKITKLLRLIPSIKLVAITGALSMNNSNKNDDIDLMIITKNNRLWLTRLLAILILEITGNRRRPQKHSVPERNIDKFCLNLWLDESVLAIKKSRQTLYTAHEIAQIKPLFDRGNTYQKFLSLNSWVKSFLPNALPKAAMTLQGQALKSSSNTSHLKISNLLNSFAFKLQYFYMKSKITREKVSLHSAFFHPRPTGQIVLKQYQARKRSVLEDLSSRPDLKGLKSEIGPEKKVLVTGIFDILHKEHINFLKKAKNSGNILLIGLETDKRVKKLKGPNRPINSIRTRIRNLQALNLADKIFSLPEKFDKPEHHRTLINQIKPDILAVSSHTPNLPAKRKLMKSISGIVKVVLSHNPKISTTKMLKSNS